MKEKWTGDIVGQMHTNEVNLSDIAEEMGVCKAYVSMILNGVRTPADGKERLQAAFQRVLDKRSSAS